jgi:hypothetical protein
MLLGFDAGPKISNAEANVKYHYRHLSARVFAHHIAQKLARFTCPIWARITQIICKNSHLFQYVIDVLADRRNQGTRGEH